MRMVTIRGRLGKVRRDVLVALMAVTLALPIVALCQSRSALQERLKDTKSRAADARDDLAAKRKRAARARNELVQCQQDLAAAEARLSRARRQLAQTRRDLADTQAELERTRSRLAAQQKAMQDRLLSMYRNEEPSYAEVVLRATTFEDFSNRVEFMKRVAQGDEKLLIRVVDDKMKVEAEEKRLEEKKREQEELKVRIARERANVAAKTEQAAALAKRAQADAAEAARQLDAMEDEIRDVEAMLRRMAESARSGGGSHDYGSWSGSLGRPVPGPVTSSFGWRIHPITHTRRFHDGIDIACSGGTPVGCAASGTVVDTGWRGPYGLTVVVNHGGGVATMYAHLERGSIQVSPGQHVGRGQTLARVDSTGWSTGNHLHWTVFRNGSAVNPFSM